MDNYWTVEAMRVCGGSFVSKLGELYRVADDENQRRIRRAWPEYWIEYTELGALLKKRREDDEQRERV